MVPSCRRQSRQANVAASVQQMDERDLSLAENTVFLLGAFEGAGKLGYFPIGVGE
jgi:hypothetical protein